MTRHKLYNAYRVWLGRTGNAYANIWRVNFLHNTGFKDLVADFLEFGKSLYWCVAMLTIRALTLPFGWLVAALFTLRDWEHIHDFKVERNATDSNP